MAKSRGALIVVGLAAAVALVLWWVRRADPDAPSDDTQSEVAGSNASARSKRSSVARGGARIPGKRVAGVVLYEGAPIAGASVRLVTREIDAGNPRAQQVVTDAAGRFDLGEQAAARVSVVADKPKLTTAMLTIDLRDPGLKPAADQLRLVLHACDAAVHGTVRDASGGPIAKARVGLPYAGDSGVEADDEGRYELCVPVGDIGVQVVADGYATTISSFPAYGRVRRDFSLVPEAIVVGQVIRADDKSPVPDALVELTSDPMQRRATIDVTMRARTDEDGKFRIGAVAPGRYVVRAQAERLASERDLDVVAEVGMQDPVTCEVTSALVVSGKVVVKGTQTPAPGVHVALYGNRRITFRTLDAVSQADGSFEVEHVLPGEYEVGVRDQDAEHDKIVVDKTDVHDVVVAVEERGLISGRVLHGGKPVDDARVSTANRFVQTDAEGNFTLRGMEAGPLELYAESKRLGAFTRGNKIALAKGEKKTGVELMLDLAGSIEGRVVDQNDAPVAGVTLAFSLLRGSDYGAATTAEDGTFKAGALSGGGEYTFQVRSPDGAVKFAASDGKRFAPIAVRDGQTHVTGVKIAIRYERLSISGRVVTSKGPLPDALVRIEADDNSWNAPSTRTDVNGAFTVGDLRAGEYAVRVSTPRASRLVEKVAAGRRDVVVELADPGSITGKLEGFEGKVMVFVFHKETREQYRATVTGDTFVVRNLPPGVYRVYAATDGYRGEVEVAVTSNNATAVTLSDPGNGTINGIVVDDAGRPVADASCRATNDGTSDASGRFRIKAAAGTARVVCYDDGRVGSQTVTVVADQTVEVKITVAARPDQPRGETGFEIEHQLDEILVSSVKAGGPAERAGLVVGDILLEVDGKKASSWQVADYLPTLGPGRVVKLLIERDDKQRTITLTLGTP